jgi:hypothetical protein
MEYIRHLISLFTEWLFRNDNDGIFGKILVIVFFFYLTLITVFYIIDTIIRLIKVVYNTIKTKNHGREKNKI